MTVLKSIVLLLTATGSLIAGAFVMAGVCEVVLRLAAHLYARDPEERAVKLKTWLGELAAMKVHERPGFTGDLLWVSSMRGIVRFISGLEWRRQEREPVHAAEIGQVAAYVLAGVLLGAVAVLGVIAHAAGASVAAFLGVCVGTLAVLAAPLLTASRAHGSRPEEPRRAKASRTLTVSWTVERPPSTVPGVLDSRSVTDRSWTRTHDTDT